MAAQDPHQPLSELSPNTTSPTKAASEMVSESVKWNRTDALKDENMVQQNQKKTYVSPSDNILSPVTKKLMGLKDKRFGSGKPQSLFAKTVGKQHSQASKSTEELRKAAEDKQ